LLVYDAQAVLEKSNARRVLPLEEFFTGPGTTVTESDELLTEIRLPIPPPNTRAKFIKLGVRGAMVIAVASVAVRLGFDTDDRIRHARIALGSVAPIPMRAFSAEKVLEGEKSSRSLFKDAAKIAEEAASPISDGRASAEYRKRVVYALVLRSLNSIWDDNEVDRNE
jgi:carbon-monoxide dehydrogenase medium subunit